MWQVIDPMFFVQFGYIVLTTSAGIMDHEEARRKNVGGKVLGFFYWCSSFATSCLIGLYFTVFSTRRLLFMNSDALDAYRWNRQIYFGFWDRQALGNVEIWENGY